MIDPSKDCPWCIGSGFVVANVVCTCRYEKTRRVVAASEEAAWEISDGVGLASEPKFLKGQWTVTVHSESFRRYQKIIS